MEKGKTIALISICTKLQTWGPVRRHVQLSSNLMLWLILFSQRNLTKFSILSLIHEFNLKRSSNWVYINSILWTWNNLDLYVPPHDTVLNAVILVACFLHSSVFCFNLFFLKGCTAYMIPCSMTLQKFQYGRSYDITASFSLWVLSWVNQTFLLFLPLLVPVFLSN